MSAEQLLVKYDFDKFIWKSVPTADGSQYFSRPLAGAEIVQELYNRFEHGNQTLFFAVYLDISSPASAATIIEAAGGAWIALRHRIPILATSISVDENDTPMLEYQVQDAAGVNKWAARTLTVHHQSALDLDQLREALGGQPLPSAEGDHTWMHLVLGPPGAAELQTQIGLIFHTHHAVTDGNGAKIIMNQFLVQLGKKLDGATQDAVARRKPVPIPTSSDELPTFEHPLYRTLGGEMHSIGESMQNKYGFKTRKGSDARWPHTRRVELVFSEKDSAKLLGFMKSQPYTLTVLVMSENPATPDVIKHSLNNFCMVDVRPRLKEPYASRDGYPGYALAPPMCRIPVALFLSSDGQPLPLDKTLLLRVINFIQERYTEHRGMTVAYIAQASEMFGYAMKQGYVANESVLLSLDHFAVAYFGDTRRTPSNHCYMFSSDGRVRSF
ncbi:hypothetical protein C8J57DRAFT_1667822 [Mycena rebaudengoi]|nr:hypothetical protein C8J57DRAFT_1667822 [Mycena rebaudengoi]